VWNILSLLGEHGGNTGSRRKAEGVEILSLLGKHRVRVENTI